MKLYKQSFWFIPLLAFLIFLSTNSIAVADEFNEEIRKKPSIVFLITKDTNNYEAHETVPKFAALLEKEHGYTTTVLLGTGEHGDYAYPSLSALSNADLLIIFARRIALPQDQMNAIKEYISKGKPVIGIRTAHHAFAVVDQKIKEGHEDWRTFTADVLGCENKGYGPHEAGYNVAVNPTTAGHPILKDIGASKWHSKGGIYHVSLLDSSAQVLLKGELDGKIEPVAWTRSTGKNKVFYTSLGYPDDFETAHFRTLLINGIRWAMSED
jgi:type 1 glutamine amidotransferase